MASQNQRQPDESSSYVVKPPEQMYRILKANQSSKVWRNAYYLSTSIEDDNFRHDQIPVTQIPT